MKLPRPRRAPRRIPLWAWHVREWQLSGRRGPRPSRAPKRLPAWYWLWKLYLLARAKGKGSWAWRTYLKKLKTQPDPAPHITAIRQAITNWALWGARHEPVIDYTQSTSRDDFLHEPRGHLPMTTDCSGFVTFCYWASGAPDPSGLAYRWVGFTGTLLENAYRHGRVLTDLSLARPGDPIVVGPGTGWHTFIVVQAGTDPLVVSHGDESGPKTYSESVDPRLPKRVCQTLPV